METTGFEMAEIDLRIEGLEPDGEDGLDPADRLENIPAGPPVFRPGDLFLLGGHRVRCGSALEQDCYTAVMEKERAAVVFTDPPYNVPIAGNLSGLGAIHHRDFAMACGEMNQEEFTAFLTQACSLFVRFSLDGALHFICMDWRHTGRALSRGPTRL